MNSYNSQNKIKLLHVAFASGGVDVAIRLINRHIDPDKFLIQVIREEEHEDYFNKKKEIITSDVIPVKRNIGFADIVHTVALYRMVRKLRPDIVHLHSAKAGILGRIVTFFLGIKTFYTPHAFSFLSAKTKTKRKVFLLFESLSRFFFIKARIIACSPSEKNRAIEEVGFSPQKVLLFNNSIPQINFEDLQLNKNFNLNKRYICTIGRPSFQKNLPVMIEVLAELHARGFKEHLIILGVGHYAPDIENVKNLIESYKLENYITLIPWISRNEALAILHKAIVYISTARYEGLPLSIIEAMALGIPVVASKVDGNKDLIIEGKNGFLINDFNVLDYTEKIIELFENADLRNTFSKNQKLLFNEKYQSSKNIAKLEKIYLA